MNALELSENLDAEWKNDSLNYDTARDASAMLRRQHEAIVKLREALAVTSVALRIGHNTLSAIEQALKDTEDLK